MSDQPRSGLGKRLLFFVGLLVRLLAGVGPVHAATVTAPIDNGVLEAFFDAFVTEGLATHTLPGVAVTVVANGMPAFAKGYGYADLEEGIPVDPETTLFDVGSVAKLFTFTAVMQLVEEGRLDLHTDVNAYLTRFQVPDTYPEPVTAAHLLTHTGGFDEWDIGAAVRTPEEVLPVCEYLARRLPPRVRPPGDLVAYSNHGTALAGCLVEEITGLPFADAIEARIFAPLGMTRSTFVWPPELMADMAVGYRQAGETPVPFDTYYRHFGPAGELKTTVSDMTRFMLAHLQEGSYAGARILEPETAREMHRRQFTHHPLLPGFTYGFFEESFNGRRALVHGGDTNPTFSSLLVLLPDENVGLFVAHNTAEYAFREALVQAFMDRFFPAPAFPSPQPLPDHAERAERFAGVYAPTFMTRETSLEKLLTLAVHFRIAADATGVLTLQEPGQLAGDTPTRWIETESLVFRSLDSDDVLIFVEDGSGRIAYMATSRYPAAAFVPLGWMDSLGFHLTLLGICVLLFLSAILLWFRRRWPLSSFRGRKKVVLRADASEAGTGSVVTRGGRPTPPLDFLPALTGGLSLLFVLGLVMMLQALAFNAIFGLPFWARGLLVFPVLIVLLALALLGRTIWAWCSRTDTLAARLHDSLVAPAALAFTWQLLYWNLTVFHL